MDSQLEEPFDTTAGLRTFARLDYVKITIFGFALTALWSSLHTIVLPLRLLDFVPEASKNTYLGYLTFAGLVVAMLVQPVIGARSDRSGSAWGRRRPYILVGAVATLLLLPGIGLWSSYALVFVFYCLLQAATNTAQGAYQGFIPDLVPVNKRGRASGVKSLLELLGGISLARLAAYFMDRYSPGDGAYWLWLTLGTLGAVFLIATLVTLLAVRERPGISVPRAPLLPGLVRSFRIDVKREQDFVWFLVSRGMMAIPGVVLQTFALYYLTDVIGVDSPAAAAANLLIAVGVGLVVTVYLAGRLSDRVGRRPIVVASGLLGAVGVILLYFSHDLTTVLASGAVIGLANGALLSAAWALAADLAPRDAGARYLGLTNLALAAGSALARLIGPVIDFFNRYGENLGYSVMLLVCFVCFIAGSILVLQVKQIR
jgi:Na+/melibiose symporter-like transporter